MSAGTLQAIKILNMIKVFGKPIRVNKAASDKRTLEVGANLFVGNLDPDVDEKVGAHLPACVRGQVNFGCGCMCGRGQGWGASVCMCICMCPCAHANVCFVCPRVCACA